MESQKVDTPEWEKIMARDHKPYKNEMHKCLLHGEVVINSLIDERTLTQSIIAKRFACLFSFCSSMRARQQCTQVTDNKTNVERRQVTAKITGLVNALGAIAIRPNSGTAFWSHQHQASMYRSGS